MLSLVVTLAAMPYILIADPVGIDPLKVAVATPRAVALGEVEVVELEIGYFWLVCFRKRRVKRRVRRIIKSQFQL